MKLTRFSSQVDEKRYCLAWVAVIESAIIAFDLQAAQSSQYERGHNVAT